MTAARDELAAIRTFPQLVKYLRDELDWPVTSDDFEDLVFDYSAEDLGIDAHSAAKIQEIKRLRPLSANQPWGIFFVKFEPKRLPVVALRRILGGVALKKRASSNSPDHAAWAVSDLLFISNFGEGDERQISFAHFAEGRGANRLPTLKVLGWDGLDTRLHLEDVAESLERNLAWPDDEDDVAAWRSRWEAAFTLGHREVVSTSREMASRLAQLARVIRVRIAGALAIETDQGPLKQLMKAVQLSLVHDLDPAGFADMYAQTIAYGLLSARIADPESETATDLAGHMRTNPLLRDLLETFMNVGGQRRTAGGPGIDFDELGVAEVVDLLSRRNMEAVLRDFGDRNPEDDPVIHFYEQFLTEYDEKQRVQRGVFYTPRSVVSYIVRSVDELLRTEFGLAEGLADQTTWGELVARRPEFRIPVGIDPSEPFVQILDPATGTGTFLVEVIDVIYSNLAASWRRLGHGDAGVLQLWNDYVPRHLLPRLHGYELLMAPYAIAHLKVGLKLHETGYQFLSGERARIYLTNSLEPPVDLSARMAFAIPALAQEARAVNSVKEKRRFTVVLGNPPYSGISANMADDAQRLVDAYRVVDGAALNERKLWLQDDYVKFFRYSQNLVEQAHAGILGFVTNHGYLGNPTFRGMRQSLMGTFDNLRVIDLHGNANKKEKAPDGSPDSNVFEIRQGVAVFLGLRVGSSRDPLRADLWGTRESKYRWLASHTSSSTDFEPLRPDSPYYFFAAQSTDVRDEYNAGWAISEVMPAYSAGFITARDHFVVDFDDAALLDRIASFADPRLTDDDIRARFFAGMGSNKYPDGDTRSWKIPQARRRVQSDRKWRERVRKCLYRPFDVRSIYWADWMIDWPRPDTMGPLLSGQSIALSTSRMVETGSFEHVLCSRLPVGHHTVSIKEVNYIFPLWMTSGDDAEGSLGLSPERELNLSPRFLDDLASATGRPQSTRGSLPDGIDADLVFAYIYAVLHSPAYRARYFEHLRSDFPRVPLPARPELLEGLAGLGQKLINHHLLEAPDPEGISVAYRGPQRPSVVRAHWQDDAIWLSGPPSDKGTSAPTGPSFTGVPEAIWAFRIGGYQVCQKWLKDRRGRVLSEDDIAHYKRMLGAIFATVRLMGEIDALIEELGGWPEAFSARTG